MKWYTTVALLLLVAGVAESGELTVHQSFDPLLAEFEEADGYTTLHYPDCQLPESTPGTPWLPVKEVYASLPAGAEAARISVTFERALIKSDVLLYPAQPSTPLSMPAPPFQPLLPADNRSGEFIPESPVELSGSFRMRGHAFASLLVSPFQYDAAGRQLYILTNMTITIRYRLLDAPSTPSHPVFTETLRQLVVNPEQLASDATRQAPSAGVDYLVITTAALSNSFERLAAFRRAHNDITGQVLTLETITSTYSGTRPDGGSDTQTQIRNAIKDFVDNHGTAYVVLGGDDTVIPDRNCYVTCSGYTAADMPTDLYYGGLDSTWDENANGTYGEANYSGVDDEGDLAYDVIVGRIPIRTAGQASNYIARLIEYESYALPAGFTNRMLFCGDKLWNSYTGDSRPSDLVNDGYSEFRSHTTVSDAEIWTRRMVRDGLKSWREPDPMGVFFDTLTSWDSSTPGDYLQNSTYVQARFNEGWHQVFFATHGGGSSWGLESGSYYTSQASSLTNTTAFVYTMACLTGHFDGSPEPCLSESFLRNANGGALVYMGCSRYGWGSPGSYSGGTSLNYAYKYYEQLYSNRQAAIGSAFAEHKLARISSCGYDGSYRWVQFGMNLQGDPLVPLADSSNMPGNDDFYFTAFALTNSVKLRWPVPHDCKMWNNTVHIRCSTTDYPATTNDGTAVYTGTDTEYVHTCTPGQQQFYTIWLSDDGESFIPPR